MQVKIDEEIRKRLEKVTMTDYSEGIELVDVEYVIDELLEIIEDKERRISDLENCDNKEFDNPKYEYGY